MDEITSPQIETRVNELQGQVAQYSKYNNEKIGSSLPFSLNFKFYYVYIAIPIAILILLMVFKPSFIKTNEEIEDGTIESQTNFKKILMWTLILGTVLDVGLYGALYKLKK